MDTPRATLLLVDDERLNLEVLQDLLEPDYELLLAKSGEQALQRLRGEIRPDLILMDIMMPGMDGYEVLERLRADPATRDIPVIFVTAMGEVADEAKGLGKGAVDYITKPISLAIVQARVQTHLTLRRSLVAVQEMNLQLTAQNNRLEELNALLKNMAMQDGLTGIPNRRRFDQYLEQEWKRALREGSVLSLILIDIDFFKLYNDHYGHAAGDDCLKAVAQAMAGSMSRSVDLLARYGGEEFVCLLPGTSPEGLAEVGRKLRESVLALALEHTRSQVASQVTLSLGGASMIPTSDATPLTLVQAADERLYRAKTSGRNRVVCDLDG